MSHGLPLHPRDALREQNLRIAVATTCRALVASSTDRAEALRRLDDHLRDLSERAEQLRGAARAMAADTDEE
jgi:hypothetical protein